VTGSRIYWRSVDEDGKVYGDMYLLLEVDFRYGVRRNSSDVYEAWVDGATNIVQSGFVEFSSWPRTEVYGARSGYSQNLHSIDAKYKTAVVANRRTYIGNVKFTDKGGNEVVKGDAIIKSPVNSFDVFPATNILEATVNDGDEIVKLEVYADRLLQFKKHKLEILNISQAVEFLEETFHHKGIGHQAAVCNTDYGIAWVNKLGCYLFDGQKVIDLLEKGGIQIISESDWNTFTNDPVTKEPMIGYIPNKRQLIVVDDISTNGDGAIFLYDMVTKSWVKGSDDTIQDQVKTNFVTDWDGNLVWVHTHATSTPAQWDDTSASSSSLSIKTKDIDFGNPGQKKTVYKVYISYKGDGSSTTVKYGVNGETDAGDLYAFDSANLANKSSSENLETWHIATLKPGTASQAKDIYSFQIILGGTGGATFEINDMSIVYRLKGIR